MTKRWLSMAAFLTAAPAAASALGGVQADIRYLQNSGWIIGTAKHLLVFDYVEPLGVDSAVPAATLEAKDFDTRSLVVFASHRHSDHYSPTIAEWSKERPDIRYVLGWSEPRLPAAHVMKPREEWVSGGLVVKTTASTDEGVGFLVSVDGLTLYHAGDHALWNDQIAEAFLAEMRWLAAGRPSMDLAFFPIATGSACDPRPSIWRGVLLAAQELKPQALFPMHVRCADRLGLYETFRDEVAAKLVGTAVIAPRYRGERFRYSSGAVQRVE